MRDSDRRSLARSLCRCLPPSLQARGHADLGWLNSYHTFSFANYYDSKFESLHSLRVINEDRVSASQGFGKHPHREFEIFSYVVKGALRHQDSMGNLESLGRGFVQFTSAGTGIAHSEHNDSDQELVHFIQMWVKPNKSGLKPSYSTKKFTDAEKQDQLRLILSKDGRNGSIRIHQDVNIFASILAPEKSVQYQLQPARDIYIHLIQDSTGYKTEANKTGLTLTSASGRTSLKGGDGAFVKLSSTNPNAPQTFTLTGSGIDGAPAELILFDIKKE
jgi:redox-sensitive bicupin YhaK (pirin superfamily)